MRVVVFTWVEIPLVLVLTATASQPHVINAQEAIMVAIAVL
jgi:hypothetical protein